MVQTSKKLGHLLCSQTFNYLQECLLAFGSNCQTTGGLRLDSNSAAWPTSCKGLSAQKSLNELCQILLDLLRMSRLKHISDYFNVKTASWFLCSSDTQLLKSQGCSLQEFWSIWIPAEKSVANYDWIEPTQLFFLSFCLYFWSFHLLQHTLSVSTALGFCEVKWKGIHFLWNLVIYFTLC